MKRWLNSLHGRLVLLVVTALVVAQGVAMTIHLVDRHGYIRELNETIATRRIPAAVELLAALPESEQPRLAAALSTTWSRFLIGDGPVVENEENFSGLADQLRTALNHSAEQVRVGTVAEPHADVPEPRWSGETLTIAVHLNDGRWLTLERPLHPPLRHAVGPVVLSLSLSALAVLAVVAWLVRRTTRPLQALTTAAERFGRGDTVEPLPEAGPDDVRRTIRAFNTMSDRLQRFIADRTRMLAAISHDLRTPITALRLRSEMVDDPETRERMQRSLQEMQHMVEATLQFARAEAVQEPTEEVDLGELVEAVCADVADAGGTVSCSADETIRVLARPTALGRALRNVVDNAVFYGKRAQVSVTKTSEGALVRVDDQGDSIPEADRERVFEPFVRLENSRSAETGGTGLGLATARTIIHAHGGTIRLGNNQSGGLRVEIALPGM